MRIVHFIPKYKYIPGNVICPSPLLVYINKLKTDRWTRLFATYTYKICSEMKSGDAQRNVQK